MKKPPNKKATGDCFQVAYRLIANGEEDHSDLRLVHANVAHLTQEEPVNHAFVEDDKFVFEMSNGMCAMVPKDKYYQALGITNVRNYTGIEAIEHMIRNNSYGPWDCPQEAGVRLPMAST
jgi:hypothetical protein